MGGRAVGRAVGRAGGRAVERSSGRAGGRYPTQTAQSSQGIIRSAKPVITRNHEVRKTGHHKKFVCPKRKPHKSARKRKRQTHVLLKRTLSDESMDRLKPVSASPRCSVQFALVVARNTIYVPRNGHLTKIIIPDLSWPLTIRCGCRGK